VLEAQGRLVAPGGSARSYSLTKDCFTNSKRVQGAPLRGRSQCEQRRLDSRRWRKSWKPRCCRWRPLTRRCAPTSPRARGEVNRCRMLAGFFLGKSSVEKSRRDF